MAYWIHTAAGKQPGRAAIEGPARTLTYSELSAGAIGAAGALQRLGVRSGDRVALALPSVEDFAVALHGCLLARAVAVPIDLRMTEPSERARRRGRAGRVRAAGGRRRGTATADDRDPAVAVMHTSGTTAAPKPVALTYGNWLANALGSAVALGLDPAERWLCPMPLTHVGGLSIPIRSAIYATTAVVHGRFDTDGVLERADEPGAADHARFAGGDDARRDCSTPGCATRPRCAGRCSAAGRSRPRCWRARPRPASRWRRPTG